MGQGTNGTSLLVTYRNSWNWFSCFAIHYIAAYFNRSCIINPCRGIRIDRFFLHRNGLIKNNVNKGLVLKTLGKRFFQRGILYVYIYRLRILQQVICIKKYISCLLCNFFEY